MDFHSITWVNTADVETETPRDQADVETDGVFRIKIPDEILLKSLSINFGQNREVCEIIVAGISADDYKCPVGKYLNTDAVQCDLCPAGQYGDVKGLKTACKECAVDHRTELPGTGSKKCVPCSYIEYSLKGSSSCSQCTTAPDNLAETSCPLNPYTRGQTSNLVSDSFSAEMRSFKRDEEGDLELGSSVNVPLVSDNKPFYIYSVVLAMTGDDSAMNTVTVNSCEKSTTLTTPSRTDVFQCQQTAGLESITIQTQQTVRLKKVFVFGVTFSQAPAPAGSKNTGTKFEKCPPGTYSPGGLVTECTPCKANQEQPASGQSSCTNCQENHYSSPGDAACKRCGPDTPVCKTSCLSEQENNPTYGEYSWPTTLPGERAETNCAYNRGSMAYRLCDFTTKKFGKTDFRNCKSKVHDEIIDINKQADKITDEQSQKKVSEEIKEVAEENSGIMNSDDVKKTSEIIDKLIDFDEDEDEKLPDEVRDNILKTVDGVHSKTDAGEIARGDVAPSMRNSVEKLTKKISKDSESTNKPVYVKEETVGVVVSKTTGDDNTFTVSGDDTDYTKTGLEENDKPVLFSVKVPANKEKSAVTAILYDTPKFYPDKITVQDFSSALAAQFTSPNRTKKTASRVVSMVTEIKYVESTKRVDFESGKQIEMTYRVKSEKPRAHYRMPLKQSYECVFYSNDNETWITGASSGCKTKETTGKNGEKLVSCQCDHMTSFAVLMSFDSDYDPLEETVTSILLGISLGCLFFTIIAYLPAKEMLRTRSVRINLLLVTSLMFSIIVFYFMELVVTTNVKENKIPSETDSASFPCVIVAFLMNYFWLCQMAWMVCEALVMYRALVSAVMDSHIHRYMLKFNLACWGTPLIFPIIGVIWGQTDFANPKTCFLRQRYGLVTFYIPVIVCIVFNIFIFLRISWSIFRKQSMDTSKKPISEIERKKKQFKFAITVMTLLGVAWIFGFFLIIQGNNTIWLRWLFIIFNSTQGVFIFILYVVLNDNLKKVWRKLLNISGSDKPSHSSTVPYSRSKGPNTKQTFAATNTRSEMDPLSTTTTFSTRSKVSNVTMVSQVSECDRSRSASPRSTLMTTSLVSPERNIYKTSPSGVHIYDNVASIISDSMDKKYVFSNRADSNFEQDSRDVKLRQS